MLTVTQQLEHIIARLDAIAELNNDEFLYEIQIPPESRASTRYVFRCAEMADDHTFLDLFGPTLEEMVESFNEDDLKSMCLSWGYEYEPPTN